MATASSHLVSYDSGYNLRSDTADLQNAFTDSDSDTCALLYIVNGSNSESYIYFNFALNIPSDATIDSVSCTVKGKMSNLGGTTTRELQLFSGSTAKGTSTSITSTSLQTLTLNVGTWTPAELNNAKLRFYAKRSTGATTTNRHYDIYGATLTVSYTIPSIGDKIYVKVNGVWQKALDDGVYHKRNGLWRKASNDVYKKINSLWVNQGDKSAIFDRDVLFIYNDFRVDENISAHVNVTCFDGGDGSVTVVASGGTPPYQYSTDPNFGTYNTDGVFANLSLIAPVDEGTDQYGGILISHRRFYVRDASGQIVSCVVDLKSPVQLDIVLPDDITVFAENCIIYIDSQNRKYAIIEEPFEPYPTTMANNFDEVRTFWPDGNLFQLSVISPLTIYDMRYNGWNDCYEFYDDYFTVKILPAYYPNAIQDYDGNWYDAVVIGNQVWLASNLRTTHYADGTPIPAGGSTTSDTDPYYYDYSSSNIPLKDRGYLYNWPAVMKGAASSNLNPSGVQGIAPAGWHVPSDAEWTQLTNYVGSVPAYILDNNSTYIAKALASQSYWNASTNAYAVGNDLTANNNTLFSAVPAGYCAGSNFNGADNSTYFWSSTQYYGDFVYGLHISYNLAYPNVSNINPKQGGYSVRCVCDLSPLDFAAWYYQQYGSYNHQLPTE